MGRRAGILRFPVRLETRDPLECFPPVISSHFSRSSLRGKRPRDESLRNSEVVRGRENVCNLWTSPRSRVRFIKYPNAHAGLLTHTDIDMYGPILHEPRHTETYANTNLHRYARRHGDAHRAVNSPRQENRFSQRVALKRRRIGH